MWENSAWKSQSTDCSMAHAQMGVRQEIETQREVTALIRYSHCEEEICPA